MTNPAKQPASNTLLLKLTNTSALLKLTCVLVIWLICGDSLLAQEIAQNAAQTTASYPADTEVVNHQGFWSLVPPLLAIVLALLLKRVIPALFIGIWLGAWLIAGKSLGGLWQGLLDTFQVYVLNAMADRDHSAIILFSMMVGGMVGIISANGGMQGVVGRVIGWASDAKRAAITTWCMGLAIFFDDYANTLVVGNSMRPLADKMRISREKLAYIVDSTAAPVSCIALITTWIGYEVGLIQGATDKLPGFNEQAYWVFLNTIPYSFYPLLALLFVLLVCTMGRDFGPMYKAEKRARETGVVVSDSNGSEADETELVMADSVEHPRARNAILPILGLVITVLYGLWTTGQPDDPTAETSLREIIGNADSYQALMWGSLIGVLVAALLSMSQRILDMEETVQAWFKGVRSMLFAMIILVLAWSLGNITEQLGTATYLVEIIGDTLPLGLLPALVFLIAAGTAFATGSSWGAMGILLPLVVPLAWAMLNVQGATSGDAIADMHIMYAAIAAVLGGSVWGDHCSPISDTTILSSMASQCDHIEHVRTQLPYAMVTGLTAILICLIPSGFGLSWWLSLLLGSAVLVGILLLIGKPVANYKPGQDNSGPG